MKRLAISNWQIAKSVGALLLDHKTHLLAPEPAPSCSQNAPVLPLQQHLTGLGASGGNADGLWALLDSKMHLRAELLRAWSLAAPSTAIGFCVTATYLESRGTL